MTRPSTRLDTASDLPASPETERPAGGAQPPTSAAGGRSWWRRRRRFLVGLLAAVLFGVVLIALEARTSWLQSWALADYAEEISFAVEEGPSEAIRFPVFGPYDERLGYTRIAELEGRLHARGFETTAQARLSDRHLALIDRGLFPIYHEKSRAGLRITDRVGHPVFVAEYPDRTFSDFDEIPPILVRTLLYIENRALLDPDLPHRNPAVEWDRLVQAGASLMLSAMGGNRSVPGGSTLATQIEKFRHSPGGLTGSPREKLRQVATASLRAYLGGRHTLDAQRRIVLDYLNSVPLSGISGYGEVNGLRTGLRAWFGMDPDRVMRRLLQADFEHPPGGEWARLERGRAYRAVLGLLLAQSRPSYYLGTPTGRRSLARRTDEYLQRLSQDNVASVELARAAATARPALRLRAPANAPISFVERKGANAVRTHLLGLLEEDRLYELDRWDVEVHSTLDEPAQVAVTEELRRLGDPAYVNAVGLTGPSLLSRADPRNVVYAFLLLEATDRGNLVRVQTDNFEGPLDLNLGGKLELGSTAKLRTLVTYLEIVEELYQELAELEPAGRDSLVALYGDALTRWARDWLRLNQGAELSRMLAAAMERRYSASPGERFFTGGGVHTFSNFDATHDSSFLSVNAGFRQSINLVFIRLMRDVVRYEMLRVPGSTALALEAAMDDPVRQGYLSRFADREGRIFINRFYAGLEAVKGDRDALVNRVIGGRTMVPLRLARIFRAVDPDAPVEDLAAFLRDGMPAPLDEGTVGELFRRASPEEVSWPDLGYLASVHPLELWMARHLARHPDATRSEVVAGSADVRQEVYRWLFTTRRRSAQDQRIRTMLEIEAFASLSRRWQRLGYPFAQLVPSYATAIGSSGDRPAALAELVGILVNDGIRRPTGRVDELRFGESTPFETTLRRVPEPGTRVVSADVARAARRALLDVVENGTARRVFGALVNADGTALAIGGKTGTGDNRAVVVGPRGSVLDSRTVSRTSTFVFFLGDRFFGVVTAYVDGAEAAGYRFTSALPVQLLRQLSPRLQGLVDSETDDTGSTEGGP